MNKNMVSLLCFLSCQTITIICMDPSKFTELKNFLGNSLIKNHSEARQNFENTNLIQAHQNCKILIGLTKTINITNDPLTYGALNLLPISYKVLLNHYEIATNFLQKKQNSDPKIASTLKWAEVQDSTIIPEFKKNLKQLENYLKPYKCAVCEKTSFQRNEAKFQYCSQCKDVYYCGKDCQSKDWKNGHKTKCKPQNKNN